TGGRGSGSAFEPRRNVMRDETQCCTSKLISDGAPLRADRFFRIEKIPFTVSAAFNDKSIIADRLITDHLRRSSGGPKHHKRRIHRIDTRSQGGPKGQSFSLQRECVIK